MRALVTGIAGFAGSHLADYLLAEPGLSIAGVVKVESDLQRIHHLLPRLRLFYGDVGDYRFLESAVAEWQPDYVFHLAAQAAPSRSWEHGADTLSVNILGQYNILEAIAQKRRDARVLVVGSADEYGMVTAGEIPVKEDTPMRPGSPYAVSKIAQDMLGLQFFINGRLNTVRVRPFNHLGPRQGPNFVTASLAKQIAEAECGQRPAEIAVGNLETKRDFSDVRDIVRAYWLAATKGKPGDVYNLGRGRSHSIGEVLEMLLDLSQLEIKVTQDPNRLRPSDVPDLVCDASKFRDLTGWRPLIPLEESLADVLTYWRSRGSAEGGRR